MVEDLSLTEYNAIRSYFKELLNDFIDSSIFNYILAEYQIDFFEAMKGCDFLFDYVGRTYFSYFSCHKMTLKEGHHI